MTIKEITNSIEDFAPLSFQESYDNSGLLIGDENSEISSVLLAIDITEEVIEEATKKQVGLIICHHPLIFSGLKRLTNKTLVERCVTKAIKNNIAIYACHTNIDSVEGGVSSMIAEKIGLQSTKILSPTKNSLCKLVTYAPSSHASEVRMAILKAGAGNIGNYDHCSFNTNGYGTFRGNENSKPFVGKIGEIHTEEEIKIESIFPKHIQSKVLKAMFAAHPYEEVAYDIFNLENTYNKAGMGIIGKLSEPEDEMVFLKRLKDIFSVKMIRHSPLKRKPIEKVAVCGGAGSFLINNAIAVGADILITGDIKYHQFFDADSKIVIADIGHFESEQYTTEIFYRIIKKKNANFAVHFSNINTNPINYI